jgi:hypothetical protein
MCLRHLDGNTKGAKESRLSPKLLNETPSPPKLELSNACKLLQIFVQRFKTSHLHDFTKKLSGFLRV